MTGLECLKEEMLKRGCSKALTESKAVGVVLEIVADGGTVYTDTREAEEKLNALRREIEQYEVKGEMVREIMTDLISRQATIDEVEYELEMINSALDSLTLDFNARERLRQRKSEAREILNSIQVLPSAYPKKGKWNKYYRMHSGDTFVCNRCGSCFAVLQGADKMNFCPNCGCRMDEE